MLHTTSRLVCAGILSCLAAAHAPAAEFLRGDVDASESLTVTDAIRVLSFLFLGDGGAVTCRDAADADDSGAIDVTDALFVLNALFRGGSVPPPPFSGCGSDPTEDQLDCVRWKECIPPFEYFGFEFQSGAAFFVIDRSGTQQDNGELERSKAETVEAIASFEDGTEFGVFFADRGLLKWPSGDLPAVASPEVRETGVTFVKAVSGGSGSCDIPALLAAVEMAKGSTAAEKVIFYVGDGGGTCPGFDEATYLPSMRKEVTEANAGTARIHTILTGPPGSIQKAHMEELARLNGGSLFEGFR